MARDLAHPLASRLLKLALRVCPRETLQWGEAMLAELSYIAHPWVALRWSIGSAQVVVRNAMRSALFGTEAAMQRPRILFSIGVALLPVAVLFLGFSGITAYRFLSNYETVEVKILSSETVTRTPPGSKATYITKLNVEYEDQGQRRTGPSALLTSDSREHEKWALEYAVGTRHTMHLVRHKLQPGEIGHRPDVILETNDPIPRFVALVLLAAFGGVVLTGGLVYVGKSRAI